VLAAMLYAVAVLAESIHYEVRMVPIDRLAKNLEALVAKEPNNLQLRINLARAHAMAYALKKSELPVATSLENQGAHFGWGKPEAIPFKNNTDASPAAMKAAQSQLALAIAKYRDALAIGPRDLVANLGYAWCLSQSGDKAPAIAAYRRTIELAWEAEREGPRVLRGTPSITEEASTYLIPMLDAVTDAAEIARLRDRIAAIEKVMKRWITPIAVPLSPGLNAGDLRDDNASVLFDADGSGIAKRWTWITSKAGWTGLPSGVMRIRTACQKLVRCVRSPSGRLCRSRMRSSMTVPTATRSRTRPRASRSPMDPYARHMT
jgi:tetratricopeptide (TPR) repeat protein